MSQPEAQACGSPDLAPAAPGSRGPLVSIQAPCNGSGKTRLAVALLEALPGLAAVKASTIYRDGGNCPRHAVSGCACGRLGRDPYRILDDPAVLGQPDTDTGRFLATGAPTWWMLCRPGHHARGWAALLPRLEGRPTLLEGSRIAEICEPDLRIVVVNPHLPRSKWKAGSEEVLAEADLCVLNAWGPDGDAEAVRDLVRTRCRRVVESPEALPDEVLDLVAGRLGRS